MRDMDEKVKEAHRNALSQMETRDLILLLLADDSKRYPEDDWFRDLIRDELKKKEREGSLGPQRKAHPILFEQEGL